MVIVKGRVAEEKLMKVEGDEGLLQLGFLWVRTFDGDGLTNILKT